jgi:hypothetical protein
VGLFTRQTLEQRFWRWFEDNSERLFNWEADQERVFADLKCALAKVNAGLVFEFGPARPDRREFTVSADGVRKLFPAVIDLVAAAPSLPRWEVLAFRQPVSDPTLPLTLEFNSLKLSTDDVWFVAQPRGDVVGLHLFIRGLTADNNKLLSGAAFVLLDSVLGEYVVETQVGSVDSQPLPDRPEVHGLSPFSQVREVFGIKSAT